VRAGTACRANLFTGLETRGILNNALTVDLEDYYHVSAFAKQIDPASWGVMASRVEGNTQRLLDVFAAADCKATFFSLGWAAEQNPALVLRVAEAGHEIACHSHQHRYVYALTPSEFREDTARAKKALEDASGRSVVGYRAPSFSITTECLWAYEILAELGFVYDSSVFPVRHPNYGMHAAHRFPYKVATAAGDILEFPMPTLNFYGRRSPFGGGAYLRLLPEWYTKWAVRYVNEAEGQPVCMYLHPWEIDPGQPRMRGAMSSRLRHYMGLGTTERKLCNLLKQFSFCQMSALIGELYGREPGVSLEEFVPNEKMVSSR